MNILIGNLQFFYVPSWLGFKLVYPPNITKIIEWQLCLGFIAINKYKDELRS